MRGQSPINKNLLREMCVKGCKLLKTINFSNSHAKKVIYKKLCNKIINITFGTSRYIIFYTLSKVILIINYNKLTELFYLTILSGPFVRVAYEMTLAHLHLYSFVRPA